MPSKQGNCYSKMHLWLDEYCAKYCCNPAYAPVMAKTAQELSEIGAVAIHPVAEGMMWSGWVQKDESELTEKIDIFFVEKDSNPDLPQEGWYWVECYEGLDYTNGEPVGPFATYKAAYLSSQEVA